MFYTCLRVAAVTDVGPRLRRVTLTGDALAGFTTLAPDQQLKLFFARDGGVPRLPEPPADAAGIPGWYARYRAVPEALRPWMRTYSVRAARPAQREIDVDFVLHAGATGPASRWAVRAVPGDVVGCYGPAPSHRDRPPAPGAATLFVTDPTGLPAVAAWLATLHAGEQAVVHAEVVDAADEQELPSAADVEVHWHHRGAAPTSGLPTVLRAGGPPRVPLWTWLAGEAGEVRTLRRLVVEEWGLPRGAVCSGAYWRRHLTQDDDPTPADIADAAPAGEETR